MLRVALKLDDTQGATFSEKFQPDSMYVAAVRMHNKTMQIQKWTGRTVADE